MSLKNDCSQGQFCCTVEGFNNQISKYNGYEYEIKAIYLEDGFDIGLAHKGDKRPTDEIIPKEAYETIVRNVRSHIDIDEVRSQTTRKEWPSLGTCRLRILDDGSMDIQVDLNHSE